MPLPCFLRALHYSVTQGDTVPQLTRRLVTTHDRRGRGNRAALAVGYTRRTQARREPVQPEADAGARVSSHKDHDRLYAFVCCARLLCVVVLFEDFVDLYRGSEA